MAGELNLKHIPPLVGEGPKKLMKEIYELMVLARKSPYLVGPSGSGKSVMAMNLAKRYAKKYEVPAYYVQLSPEQTKTNLILGLRLINGSLVPTNGVVADAMESGGVIVVDEATLGTQEMLLMFNSILDRTAVTSIGDKIVEARDTFRVIFCANDSSYAGNTRLPQSFAQRLVSFFVGYNNSEEDVEIVKAIVSSEMGKESKLPDSMYDYAVNVLHRIRQADNGVHPLSVRNASSFFEMLSLKATHISPKEVTVELSETQNANIYEMLCHNKSTSLVDVETKAREIKEFAASYSLFSKSFIEHAAMVCFMGNLDVDVGFQNTASYKEVVANQAVVL